MPNVKGKKFPYTKEGIKASKEYAESDARGRSQKYQLGGEVLPEYKEGGKVFQKKKDWRKGKIKNKIGYPVEPSTLDKIKGKGFSGKYLREQLKNVGKTKPKAKKKKGKKK